MMKKCPLCGKLVRPGEKYCWNCEQDIAEISGEEE
jgi:uncharacterized OB-fold protein|tara:strand:- start:1406 stop:1510 length:105 start_codon:yes stop_codon:yes gene_type:complete